VLIGASTLVPSGSEIILEIRSTASGVPGEDTSSLLADTAIPANSLPAWPFGGFVLADISGSGLTVSAGDELAIVLRAPDIPGVVLPPTLPIDIQWSGNGSNEYDMGAAFEQRISEGAFEWELIPPTTGEVDFGFRTHVQVIPNPPAVWLFGSGLLGLIGIAQRKKEA